MSTVENFANTYEPFSKATQTSRGLTYRYLSVPGTNDITLLWLHGFPSSVYDWHFQLDHFRAKGYALIAPDMLGYGGTDKPTDPALFKRSHMASDIVDIVDKEVPAGRPVVAIAHDHGVNVLTRLADVYQDRFAAFVFISVGYLPPAPEVPYEMEKVLAFQEKALGKTVTAYWEFFGREDAAKIIENNFDSLLDSCYARESLKVWSEVLNKRGKTLEWFENAKRCDRATFISDEEFASYREHLIGPGRGLTSPLNWYKAFTQGFNQEDDKDVVARLGDKFPVKIAKPVFFAGTAHDAVCFPAFMRLGFKDVALDLTDIEFDASHWLIFELPTAFNEALEKWLGDKVNV